ncbi:nucleoside hydrolase-like domain-containing protein [Posidoniimonas polymericola]|uniref:nucleoside hydrolase-like domain-containing protein n=1 Tax=Posidoniimonas polymericola TaxID=2528002 RepID=UPI001E59BD15|nr:nucleoside hydrolase-like domain-containing protein [Posidoniimonas polymericola]
MNTLHRTLLLPTTILACLATFACAQQADAVSDKPRVIVTTDGEIDDECSMVRFLLYANEFDVEGIVTSSSQYHWQGHKWAGDEWIQPLLEAYEEVYPNLIQHDPDFPTPDYLRSITVLGNVKSEGDMDEETAGSQLIAKVLLDDSDNRPIWLQAWGGPNTIARALKTIEEKHPGKMAAVAKKIRFYFIWEQDDTYQKYIRQSWGKFNIPTIVSDQFIAFAYERQRKAVPQQVQRYFSAKWMNENALHSHGPLLEMYKAHDDGRFRSEGDSPAFLQVIPTGLRSDESPDWGGWGGRFTKVRENTWLDHVAEHGYEYPEGRWYGSSAWGRRRAKRETTNDPELTAYLKPQWRWIDAIQRDFAARADWCVKSYDEANHPPDIKLAHDADLQVSPGEAVSLSAAGTSDPDEDALTYRWWQYAEADSAESQVDINNAGQQETGFVVPSEPGKQVHIILEVTDNGSPPLVRYQRIVCSIE